MIKLRGQEHELKFGFQAHKELQEIIKKSGQDPVEFISGKEPLLIQISLKKVIPDVSIEEIEEAIEEMSYPELNQLLMPYLKYYSPNAELPK